VGPQRKGKGMERNEGRDGKGREKGTEREVEGNGGRRVSW